MRDCGVGRTSWRTARCQILVGDKHMYEVLQTLGKGAHGKVRTAFCVDTRTLVACKTIKLKYTNPAMVQQEYRLLRKFGSAPFITPAYELIHDDEAVHIISELCRGGTLQARVDRGGPLSSGLAARHCQTLAEFAVACGSKGVLHNDLKPENILLADDTPNSAIKVADFGLARPVARFADGLQPLQPYGTLGFTAPEVETCYQCTPASDMYGIGAVLYYMLCGDTHFYCQQGAAYPKPRNSDNKLWAALDLEAQGILTLLLDASPERRLTPNQLLHHPWLYEAQGLPYPFGGATQLLPAVQLGAAQEVQQSPVPRMPAVSHGPSGISRLVARCLLPTLQTDRNAVQQSALPGALGASHDHDSGLTAPGLLPALQAGGNAVGGAQVELGEPSSLCPLGPSDGSPSYRAADHLPTVAIPTAARLQPRPLVVADWTPAGAVPSQPAAPDQESPLSAQTAGGMGSQQGPAFESSSTATRSSSDTTSLCSTCGSASHRASDSGSESESAANPEAKQDFRCSVKEDDAYWIALGADPGADHHYQQPAARDFQTNGMKDTRLIQGQPNSGPPEGPAEQAQDSMSLGMAADPVQTGWDHTTDPSGSLSQHLGGVSHLQQEANFTTPQPHAVDPPPVRRFPFQRGHGPREPVDRRHEFSGRPLEGSRWIASGYVTRESDVDRLSAELCTAQRRLAQQQEELWSERQARLRAEAECDHLCDDYDALERRVQESQNRLAIVEAQQGCAGQPQGEAQQKGCRVQPLQHDTCSTAVANNLGTQTPCDLNTTSGTEDSGDVSGAVHKEPSGGIQVPERLAHQGVPSKLNRKRSATQSEAAYTLTLAGAEDSGDVPGAVHKEPSGGIQVPERLAHQGVPSKLKRKRSAMQSEAAHTLTLAGKADSPFSGATAVDDMGPPCAKRLCQEIAVHAASPNPTNMAKGDTDMGAAAEPLEAPLMSAAAGPSGATYMAAADLRKKGQDVPMPDTPHDPRNRLRNAWAGN